MRLMIAWGTGDRSILQKSIRGRTMSSAKRVWPVHLARASTLRNGLPITFGGLLLPLLAAIDLLVWRLRVFAEHASGGKLDRFVDLYVPGATAEVSCKGLTYLVAVRGRILLEQLFRCKQKAGSTVTALCGA